MRNKLYSLSIFPIGSLLIIHFSIIIPIWPGQVAQAQWVKCSNGMSNSNLVSSFITNGNNIFAGIAWPVPGGLFLSTNNGTIWVPTSLGNRSVRALAINGSNIFAGIGFGYGVYMSTDNGINWTQTSLNNYEVRALAINGNNVFAGTFESGVYKSTDNGINWTQTSLNNRLANALAINGNNIFAGTYNYPNLYGGVYFSTNNGTDWTQTSLNNEHVFSLVINGNNIFAGTSNGVYLSTNNGLTWTQTSLDSQIVYSLAVNGNNVFAGTGGNGVYVSNNNGSSWTQRNEGLGNAEVNALCLLNNYIFAGTSDSSVYRRPLGELIGIKPISEQIPESYSLSQNYPNPFNPTTKINLSIPLSRGVRGVSVRLIIYDILGREIATLVNEQLKPGTYEVEWDGSNYPSGVYFYQLKTDNFSQTKKLVLLK